MEEIEETVQQAGKADTAFTCVSCRVVFATATLQREHYKSDWHRYNLKRKVAELGPVTAEVFNKKVLLQRSQAEAALAEQAVSDNNCAICRKSFGNAKSLENHMQSKKHKEAEARQPAVGEGEKVDVVKTRAKQSTQTAVGEKREKSVDDIEMSDDEEDEEEWHDGDGLGLEECFFCDTVLASLNDKLEHMSVVHGFFVPDVEFCTDLSGLILYLGEKVGCGYVCLWCNERGKSFRTLGAVQTHMRDKGHCKVWHDDGAMVEYAEYFDYTSSYPEDARDGVSDEEPFNVPVLSSNDKWELVLPSGAVIGHRSLARYYRQNLKPMEGTLVAYGGADSATNSRSMKNSLLKQYRSLGWTGCTTNKAQATQRAKDIRFWKKFEAKNQLRLGVKANKLQRYFKRQDINL